MSRINGHKVLMTGGVWERVVDALEEQAAEAQRAHSLAKQRMALECGYTLSGSSRKWATSVRRRLKYAS